ncbi:type II toxin-antitoxin system Phd/YefM family antitoxin [Knoellia sp. Soil729]|uniref:type II toxin-antitoxin system Phd/YefM family antitoxin n=1 Tax=Knoellia sp. Soil729 TaxID=1736394 RepID=UPI0006F209D9|nr:type II toxin-antitoxin system prevent-host-death family antitoxin [Knoellia sp. Soil729]KRE43835.1 prevent-host-death protein [Knoellia sp. Soil729]
MPTQVNVHEAKSQLSKLIEKVLAGEQVTIARAGKPVVDLVVHEEPKIVFGVEGWIGVEYDDDVVEGIDPDIQEMFYGKDWDK